MELSSQIPDSDEYLPAGSDEYLPVAFLEASFGKVAVYIWLWYMKPGESNQSVFCQSTTTQAGMQTVERLMHIALSLHLSMCVP